MEPILIHTGTSYPVYIGNGILANVGEAVKRHIPLCTIAQVSDDTVDALYGAQVADSLRQAGYQVRQFSFPAGEGSKSLSTLGALLEFLAEHQLTRSDAVVALGGGVTGDLAGFAAAVYLRGIPYVQIPTTLLAAVDSSVGGKTAVDLQAGKNLAGAFHQPRLVLCDCQTFATLPENTLLDGVAEGMKAGVLKDPVLFQKFQTGEYRQDYPAAVSRCVQLKGEIVSRDERDGGERQLLNLGHTVGHGVDACSNFQISHGHAVAIGMSIIARAAAQKGICTPACAKEIQQALQNCGLPTHTAYTSHDIAQAALHDKKRQGGKITLVVPERIGLCRLLPIPLEQLEEWIQSGRKDITT